MTKPPVASFKLFIRCCDCLAVSSKRLDVPDFDDAPTSVDELVESAFLADVRFGCQRCDSSIGEIVGINQMEEEFA